MYRNKNIRYILLVIESYPCSHNIPVMEEHPGPPFNQITRLIGFSDFVGLGIFMIFLGYLFPKLLFFDKSTVFKIKF